MSGHQEYQSAEYITPRYEVKHDGDGHMLFLENRLTGEAFVLCGEHEEIQNVLQLAYQQVTWEKHAMKPVQQVIQRAMKLKLVTSMERNFSWGKYPEHLFESRRTFGSGVEFLYNIERDEIVFATQTIDGTDLEPEEFLEELHRSVSAIEYANARKLKSEEQEETEHNEEDELIWLVTTTRRVEAPDRIEAIEKSNDGYGSLVSQDAEVELLDYEVSIRHRVKAEDADHAIKQFHDIAGTDPDKHHVTIVQEVK